MKNLKKYTEEQLQSLPKRQSMHSQYNSLFGKMDSYWDSNREYHGGRVYHKSAAIFTGSVGKTKSQIVARIAEFWPSSWYKSAEREVEDRVDYRTKVIDGVLMFQPKYLYHTKAYFTKEEIEEERKAPRRYRYYGRTEEYYFDKNNILCAFPSLREAKEVQPRKEYYEKLKAKRKAQRERFVYEEAKRQVMWALMAYPGYLQAYRELSYSYRKKSEDRDTYEKFWRDNGSMMRYWYNRMNETQREVNTLWRDLQAVLQGNFTVLEARVAKIEAEDAARQKQKELSLAA